MSPTLLGVLLLSIPQASQPEAAHRWSDSTGKFTFEADLIGHNSETVVLQRRNKGKDLVSLPIDKLSKADQEYLKSKEAGEMVRRSADQLQTWTMRNGLKVAGRIVEYGRKDVTIQRRRGKTYVNDRMLSNLPDVQQRIIAKSIGHAEMAEIEDEKDLDKWIIQLKGEPRTYTFEGVLLELENGDEYGVPFFFFSDQDLKVLDPGWQRWLAADKVREDQARSQKEKEHESLMLRTAAQAYHRDREVNQQIKGIELELLAAAAGATDLWEVQLFPGPGVAAYPRIVVVPGRDSREAKQVAMQRYPGFTAGSVAQANRPF